MGRRTSLSGTVAVFTASVLLSGCGGGGTTQADAGTSHSAAPATPATATMSATPATTAAQAEAPSSSAPSKADLDTYAATAERGMKSALGPSIKKVYSSIRIEPVYPSGIKYVYVFKEQVHASKVAKYLDTQVPLLKAAFRTQVAPEMKRLGYAHPSATWTYLNHDGSPIWSRTIS